MILVLAAAIALSVFVVWLVTTPLFSAENMDFFSASYKGFADESELRQLLQLRDQLFARLVKGTASDERISKLSDSECFQALVSLSLRLQRAELPYLPKTSDTLLTKNDSGAASLGVLIALAGVFLGSFAALKSSFSLAQNAPGSLSAPSPAKDIQSTPPPLVLIEPGYYVPQSNRYMVSPAQGYAAAHHLTTFSVPSALSDGVNVVLPLPEKIYDWQLTAVRPETLSKSITVINWNGIPTLQIPSGTQGLVVEVSNEFKLNGFTGRTRWQNKKLPVHPGEQILVLFESTGVLRSLLGSLTDQWNIWPPRISEVREGLNLQNREIAMNPSLPPRKVQIVSRKSSEKQPYLDFEIIGMAPNRLPLVVLGGLVAAILFGVALFVLKRSALRAQPERSLEN